MPAFEDKLSDQERWQLVDYIRTFAKGVGTSQGKSGTLRRSRSLQFCKRLGNFLHVRHSRDIVVLEPRDLARLDRR